MPFVVELNDPWLHDEEPTEPIVVRPELSGEWDHECTRAAPDETRTAVARSLERTAAGVGPDALFFPSVNHPPGVTPDPYGAGWRAGFVAGLVVSATFAGAYFAVPYLGQTWGHVWGYGAALPLSHECGHSGRNVSG